MAGRTPSAPDRKEEGTCPVLENPDPNCYCWNLTSLTITQAVYYCLHNFRECPIYQRIAGSPG